MPKIFPQTMKKLMEIQGFQGAIIVNFCSNEVLDYSEDSAVDLYAIGQNCADMVKRHAQMIQALELTDLPECFLITTQKHYHLVYVIPQFECVALYLLVNRYTMLSHITEIVEDAIYAMH